MKYRLGLYFREKRVSAGLTQSDVAQALGYDTPQVVSNWERGVCEPPSRKLRILLNLFDVKKREFAKVYLQEQIRQLDKLLS